MSQHTLALSPPVSPASTGDGLRMLHTSLPLHSTVCFDSAGLCNKKFFIQVLLP